MRLYEGRISVPGTLLEGLGAGGVEDGAAVLALAGGLQVEGIHRSCILHNIQGIYGYTGLVSYIISRIYGYTGLVSYIISKLKGYTGLVS